VPQGMSLPEPDGLPRPSGVAPSELGTVKPAPVEGSSGRVKHDEKITVYLSRGELLDLEQARLVLRAEYGIAIDRGRIVRESLALMLADLNRHGEQSELVRRLGA